MRLLWVVSCRGYELRDDDTVDIEGAGVNTFWVDSLPADLEVHVVMRLALLENEEGIVEAHFLGPRMTNRQSADVPIEAAPLLGHLDGFEVHMTQPLTFRFEAEEEGTHSVELYLPDGRRESLFWVVRIGYPPWDDL